MGKNAVDNVDKRGASAHQDKLKAKSDKQDMRREKRRNALDSDDAVSPSRVGAGIASVTPTPPPDDSQQT
eukprot:3332962-Amphidinium_carterae.1